ncbi:MAG TPA: PRTRC system protein E [Candidatus Competibacteraceae bacterium]|nr:PRTRC system protein E [Candidatus Competibacteraceae bacterium]
MSLLSDLVTCLGAGERLRIEVQSEDDQTLHLLIQPLLPAASTTAQDADTQRLRAALAHPLCLRGTPEQLDVEGATALRRYAEQRHALHAAATELAALDAAIQQAQQTVREKRQKATTAPPPKPAAAAPALAPAPAPTDNPDSLF